MQTSDVLLDAFDRIATSVHAAVDDLEVEALHWRPDPEANSIGWLVWHLSRIRDDHVCALAGWQQTWTEEAWAPRFGLPADATDLGYGHSAEQVAALRPDGVEGLLRYHDRVAHRTRRYLEAVDAAELDRVVDTSFQPPVTVGIRLVSVLADDLQHVGQAAYVRGLWQRRATGGWNAQAGSSG